MGGVLSALEPVPFPDRLTGEQRRQGRIGQHWLPSKPQFPLLPPDEELAKHVVIESGLVDVGRPLFDREQGLCHWMTVVPMDLDRVTKVVVFFHGFTDHCGAHFQNMMLTFAHLHGVACIGFDMPGHGRSDGLHLFIESWHGFVDYAVAFCDTFVPGKVREWSDRLKGRPLKVFAAGLSMGGGVLAHVCLLQPDRFDGAILVSPMLEVAPEVRPHPVVERLFADIVVPLIPTWPVLPGKPAFHLLMHDVEAATRMVLANDLGAGETQPRLRTAVELGVVACEWIQQRLHEFRTPLLAFHAGDDRVTSPDVSRKLHEVAASTDKELKIVEGAWHSEVFFGFDGDLQRECYQYAADWLEARSK